MNPDAPEYRMTIVDPLGRVWELVYVFELDYDYQPNSCAAYIDDVCVDGEVDDFMPIWRAFKKDEADRAAEERMACASF